MWNVLQPSHHRCSKVRVKLNTMIAFVLDLVSRQPKQHRMLRTMKQYLLIIALLQSSFRMVLAQDEYVPCTWCADGTVPDDGFEGTSCGFLPEETISMTPADDPACAQAQLLAGYKECGCPTFPDAYCNMCDYGNAGYKELSPRRLQNLVIPGAPIASKTCKEAEFPLSNETAFCSYVQTAAWYCGCPNAERAADSNYVCNDKSEPANSNRILPPDYELTCGVLDRAGGIGVFDFEATVQAIPLDVQGYCGCTQDVKPPANCSVCGDEPLLNGNYTLDAAGGMTCNELDAIASWINTNDGCTTLQDDFGALCCMEIVPMTPMPVTAPSPMAPAAPVAAPTVQPVVSPMTPAPTTSSALTASLSTFGVLVPSPMILMFL